MCRTASRANITMLETNMSSKSSNRALTGVPKPSIQIYSVHCHLHFSFTTIKQSEDFSEDFHLKNKIVFVLSVIVAAAASSRYFFFWKCSQLNSYCGSGALCRHVFSSYVDFARPCSVRLWESLQADLDGLEIFPPPPLGSCA